MMHLYAALLSPRVALTGTIRTLGRDISNVENLVITDDDRLFITGREGVYEFAAVSGRCTRRIVPIDCAGLPRSCMKNGIAAHGTHLYLACAHVFQESAPFASAVLPDVNRVDQDLSGLLQLSLAAMAFRVESWILRCDLTQGSPGFSAWAPLPGGVLANGIAVDEGGHFLYVANSAPGAATGIYRLSLDDSARAELWCRPAGCKPNGLKVSEGTVWYTGNSPAAAVFGGVPIEIDGSAGSPLVVNTAPMQILDDLACVRQGFLLTHFSDGLGLDQGSLHFVSRSGRRVGVLESPSLSRPCAVAVAKRASGLFDADDVLIADKRERAVLVFKPDDLWCDWLRAA